MTQHVLAAEDSPTQAAALRAHLERAGFDVTLVSDGAQALEQLEQQSFDVVLSDINMPDVNGYDLCRQVKARDPRIPVVLLTSMDDPLDVVNALSAGADNFLRKPYKPEELIHRLRNMLHNKHLRDAGRTQMGLELFFLGRRFMINADREQILDLLVSTFEDLVEVNQQLRRREDDLAHAHEQLSTRLAETELERDRLDAVLAAIPTPVGVFDRDGITVKANEHLTRLTGDQALEGRLVWDTIHFTDTTGQLILQHDRTLHKALCGSGGAVLGTRFELFLQRQDGDLVPVVARSQPIHDRDGNVIGAVGTLEDLRELSEHDAVTALPGRKILVETLRTVSQDADACAGVVALVIDRYDRLRESLGGGVDEVTGSVASKLRQLLQADEVARRTSDPMPASLGNGEFVLILPDVDDHAAAMVVAEVLTSRLAGPVLAQGVELDVSVSAAVGMCAAGDDPATVASSVTAAARRGSVEGGQRVVSSDGAMHARVVDFLRREQELRTAIADGQLVAHYQPQVDVRDGHPVAVEALVRWQHPDRGLLGAGEVIPLAIESGLIADVSWVVLDQACAQAAEWRQTMSGAADLVLSVNFAAEQLKDPAMADRVADVLRATGLDPRALVIEITEGSVMDDPEAASRQLEALKSLGVRVAVDDFGTGYSSLLQLRRLPIDVLKIDRGFIDGMVDDAADGAIVAGTVRLARALGLGLVAEGVETADQLVQLRILGCDHAQGFLWARPLGPEELASWWSQQHTARLNEETVAQPLLDLDERQDEVVSYLVHELRSPLSAIVGYAGLLEHKPQEAREMAAAILRNSWELENRLAALTESVDVLRGGLTIAPEPTDIVELVRVVTEDLTGQLSPHPISVTGGGPIHADVDRGRFTQAVSNLLTNAGKFSPDESPIEVDVSALDDLVVVSVRDHGPGVPNKRRTELFRRFSRLGSNTKGMGVGLYLARSIVEAHGGVLTYDHAPGGGALFSIKLSQSPAS